MCVILGGRDYCFKVPETSILGYLDPEGRLGASSFNSGLISEFSRDPTSLM